MPNRIVREAILSSEKIASLGWPEEVFYRRLMSIVDDYGRTEANPQYLRSRCYPLQTDAVRVADITRWMAACQKAGVILSYAAEGKEYLEVCNFQQQRRSESKCPEPPLLANDINCSQMKSSAHLGVVVSVVEDVVVSGARKRGATPKTTLPADFAVSERVANWAREKGFSQLDKHLDHFRLSAQAKGYTYADWDSAFMKAVSDNWAKLAAPSTADQPGGGRRPL